MRGFSITRLALLFFASIGPALGQSFETDGAIRAGGNLETDAQLVSNAPEGTEPLVVGSTTMVRGLNADRIDGLHGADLALETDLQAAEAMLVALQSQVDSIGVAPPRRSGQANCYNEGGSQVTCGSGVGQGRDGHLQAGVAWPMPRFSENGDGTVTDHLSGLVWLRDANCEKGRLDWVEALAFARTLFDGSTDHNGGDCGLADGSLAGEWRVPNPVEFQTLFHYGFYDPAIPNTVGTGQWSAADPFVDVRSDFYWTGSSFEGVAGYGWLGNVMEGSIRWASKPGLWRVWLVRNPHP